MSKKNKDKATGDKTVTDPAAPTGLEAVGEEGTEGAGNSSQSSAVSGQPDEGKGAETSGDPGNKGAENAADEDENIAAAIVHAIESGKLTGDELKTVQDALTLSRGPGGSNENADAAAELQSGKEDTEEDAVDGPLVIEIDLRTEVDEDEISGVLDEWKLPAPEARHPGKLSDKEIARELNAIGDPLLVVQECNGLWKKTKEASEFKAERVRRVLNLLLFKRQKLEEACMKLQDRSNRLREEVAKREEKSKAAQRQSGKK